MFEDEHQPLLPLCFCRRNSHPVEVVTSWMASCCAVSWMLQYMSSFDFCAPMWFGLKGHGTDTHPLVIFFYPPFSFNSHFCPLTYLLSSVIITVVQMWTLTYTELATPLEFSILFSSKDIVKMHLCLIFGSSPHQIWMGGSCMALLYERFRCHLPSSIKKGHPIIYPPRKIPQDYII